MIITARQLEDLHRTGGSNGHVTLPYRARLTPLAADFIRARKIVLGYSDVDGPCSTVNVTSSAPDKKDCNCGCGTCGDQNSTPSSAPLACGEPGRPAASRNDNAGSGQSSSMQRIREVASGEILYWCDGPSGPAKAAIGSESKQSPLRPLQIPPDSKRIVAVVKTLAAEIKQGRASGGILLVQNGAPAIVYANRCPSLRAILGTCLESVEQGLGQVAINVLVIEYPFKTLQQMKNLIGRFVRGGPALSEEVRRNFQELASCG